MDMEKVIFFLFILRIALIVKTNISIYHPLSLLNMINNSLELQNQKTLPKLIALKEFRTKIRFIVQIILLSSNFVCRGRSLLTYKGNEINRELITFPGNEINSFHFYLKRRNPESRREKRLAQKNGQKEKISSFPLIKIVTVSTVHLRKKLNNI